MIINKILNQAYIKAVKILEKINIKLIILY